MGTMTHECAVSVLEDELERIRSSIDYESKNDDYSPGYLHDLCWEEEAYRVCITKLREVWNLKRK